MSAISSVTAPGAAVPIQVGRQGIAAGNGWPLPASDAAAAVTASQELQAAQQRVQQHFQEYMAQHDQEARFLVDKASGLTIVQIVNRSTGELVRQFPTEEVVRVAQYLEAQSLSLDVKA